MHNEGSREERGKEEISYQHLLSCWDFEELLAELRRNPVLRGKNPGNPIIAKDYFARA